jgi:bifunctional ADP-heptose synthase (sugar kinase/adenylyltransferase)
VWLSNLAGSIIVSKSGTSVIDLNELLEKVKEKQ